MLGPHNSGAKMQVNVSAKKFFFNGVSGMAILMILCFLFWRLSQGVFVYGGLGHEVICVQCLFDLYVL